MSVLSKEYTGQSKTLFQQPRGWLYIGTSPNGQYWNQIMFFASEDGEAENSQ